MTKHKKPLLAAAAAVVAVIGVGVVADQLDDQGPGIVEQSPYTANAQDAPVEPGEIAKVRVALPRGARVTNVALSAPFSIKSQAHILADDRTWFEIIARNESPAPLRFVAFISFDVPPADGGL